MPVRMSWPASCCGINCSYAFFYSSTLGAAAATISHRCIRTRLPARSSFFAQDIHGIPSGAKRCTIRTRRTSHISVRPGAVCFMILLCPRMVGVTMCHFTICKVERSGQDQGIPNAETSPFASIGICREILRNIESGSKSRLKHSGGGPEPTFHSDNIAIGAEDPPWCSTSNGRILDSREIN